MALYAVGDIQGCYDPLMRLLDKVNFDQSKDTLLCVGDLVNRGPKSLKTLRLLKSLDNQCITVLGNHDIHLLSMVYGIRSPRNSDTLTKLLNAPDIEELAKWLRKKPLMVQLKERKIILCHAGIYPWWTRKQALGYANEVSDVLSSKKSCVKLLKRIYSNSPRRWKDDLGRVPRQRFIINAFTRMRFVSPMSNLNLIESGYLGKKRKNRLPWFDVPNPSLEKYRVIFGHWSALGFVNTGSLLCLDTGCVWGRHMTMVKLPKSPKNRKIKKSKIIIAPNF